MEIPFIGKKADVLNKKACVAYFNRRKKDNPEEDDEDDESNQLWV